MKHDITHVIPLLKPKAEWTCNGSTYAGLNWLDGSQTKPTESEVRFKLEKLIEEGKITEDEAEIKLEAILSGEKRGKKRGSFARQP